MDFLVSHLLRLFPKEPPLSYRCQDGAGSHHHTLHSRVLPHCKTIKNMAISEHGQPPSTAREDTSGLGLLTFLGNASKLKGDGEIFERWSTLC